MIQTVDPILPKVRNPIITAMAQESPLTMRLMDIDLAQRVSRALDATGHRKLREIEVAVSDQVVTLMGQVPSYYLKLAAQTAILNVPGTEHIINQLEVI